MLGFESQSRLFCRDVQRVAVVVPENLQRSTSGACHANTYYSYAYAVNNKPLVSRPRGPWLA
jgi:hypothetical protein